MDAPSLSALIAALPPPVELGPEERKKIIAGVKHALDMLRANKVIPLVVDYSVLLSEPLLMRDFFHLCHQHADYLAPLLRDAQGQPVRSETEALSCGATPAQIQQLLIYTAARRLFTEPDHPPPAPPAPAEKGGLFSRKTAPPPPPPRVKPDGERKLELLRPYLAFEWQLPLLKYYYFSLQPLQIAELGPDVLLLQSPAVIEWVGGFEAKTLRQIRTLLKDDFSKMLATNPYALRSLCIATPDRYALLSHILGPMIWDFYARDSDHVERVEKLSEEHLRMLGRLPAVVSTDAVLALAELPPERLRLFLHTFREVMGAALLSRFNDPVFSRTMLFPMTQTFGRLMVSDDEFEKLLALKMEAVRAVWRGKMPG